MVVLDRFDDPNSHRLHVAAGEAAVSVKPFIDYDEIAGFFEFIFVIKSQEAANIHQRIFLSAEGRSICVTADLLNQTCHAAT